jgi:hypothetical protein
MAGDNFKRTWKSGISMNLIDALATGPHKLKAPVLGKRAKLLLLASIPLGIVVPEIGDRRSDSMDPLVGLPR